MKIYANCKPDSALAITGGQSRTATGKLYIKNKNLATSGGKTYNIYVTVHLYKTGGRICMAYRGNRNMLIRRTCHEATGAE